MTKHKNQQLHVLSASSTVLTCSIGRIYRWSSWPSASPRFTHKNLSLLGRKRSSFQGLLNFTALLCSWQFTKTPSPPGTHPVRAEQACVRQSLFPILLMQSLNAVLMSGIDRQVCKGNQKRACVLCNKTWWHYSKRNPPTSPVPDQSRRHSAVRLKPLAH